MKKFLINSQQQGLSVQETPGAVFEQENGYLNNAPGYYKSSGYEKDAVYKWKFDPK